MDPAPNKHTPNFLRSLKVRKLFGQFDYDLDLTSGSPPDACRLAILYGDNGSGKTTILRLLFHLLSPVDNRGHKTVLAQIKFKTFEIALLDGTSVSATRHSADFIGDIEVCVQRGGKIIQQIVLKVTDDNSVKMSGTPEGSKVRSLLQAL